MMSRVGTSLLIIEGFLRGPAKVHGAEALKAAKERALSMELGWTFALGYHLLTGPEISIV
jgi:hypothetical protein